MDTRYVLHTPMVAPSRFHPIPTSVAPWPVDPLAGESEGASEIPEMLRNAVCGDEIGHVDTNTTFKLNRARNKPAIGLINNADNII